LLALVKQSAASLPWGAAARRANPSRGGDAKPIDLLLLLSRREGGSRAAEQSGVVLSLEDTSEEKGKSCSQAQAMQSN
jgi:hypothetical protein